MLSYRVKYINFLLGVAAFLSLGIWIYAVTLLQQNHKSCSTIEGRAQIVEVREYKDYNTRIIIGWHVPKIYVFTVKQKDITVDYTVSEDLHRRISISNTVLIKNGKICPDPFF